MFLDQRPQLYRLGFLISELGGEAWKVSTVLAALVCSESVNDTHGNPLGLSPSLLVCAFQPLMPHKCLAITPSYLKLQALSQVLTAKVSVMLRYIDLC